jgi:hypothetical protein
MFTKKTAWQDSLKFKVRTPGSVKAALLKVLCNLFASIFNSDFETVHLTCSFSL